MPGGTENEVHARCNKQLLQPEDRFFWFLSGSAFIKAVENSITYTNLIVEAKGKSPPNLLHVSTNSIVE